VVLDSMISKIIAEVPVPESLCVCVKEYALYVTKVQPVS